MSDASLRRRQRQALSDGPVAQERATRAEARANGGISLARVLSAAIGREVYIEGARLNYCGVLVGYTSSPLGEAENLLLDPCWRVGEWSSQGPAAAYTQRMPTTKDGPAVIPWSAVDQFGSAPWKLPDE